MTETNVTSDNGRVQNDRVSECGAVCDDGTRCEIRVKADRCKFHDDEREVDDAHGAPEQNTNAVVHGLNVEPEKLLADVLDVYETVEVFGVFEGLMDQSHHHFDVVHVPYRIDGMCVERPRATENEDEAEHLFRAATGFVKLCRVNVTNMENNCLSENGDTVGYLNKKTSTLLSKVHRWMAAGGVSTPAGV